MTTDIDRAEVIARQAMQQGAGVVVGGVHATLLPEHVQTFAHSTMIGEGYFTWQQLIQDYAAEGIKGMQPIYRDEAWADLDGIARITDRVINMMDEHTHYWTPYLEITRGCPRNCSFCTAIRVSGRRMRLRPVDEVVDEIERRGIKRFFLTDDNFGLNFTTDPDYCRRVVRGARQAGPARLDLPVRDEHRPAHGTAGDEPGRASGQALYRLRERQPRQPARTGRQVQGHGRGRGGGHPHHPHRRASAWSACL